jgi:hypothetical protein
MDKKQFKRLEKAVRWAVEENAKTKRSDLTWDQEEWFAGALDGKAKVEGYHYVDVTCGSTCCIAGNVVVEAGDRFIVPDHFTERYEQGDMVTVEMCLTKKREVYSVETRAEHLLGITPSQARWLFDGDNDIESVINAASEIAAEYGFTLDVEPATV